MADLCTEVYVQQLRYAAALLHQYKVALEILSAGGLSATLHEERWRKSFAARQQQNRTSFFNTMPEAKLRMTVANYIQKLQVVEQRCALCGMSRTGQGRFDG